jgi:lipoprotein-releasing system ATP-binding protein
VLIASHLSKHYDASGRRVDVLDDVSLTVERGQSVAVMGPSGCGKSTLLYLLGALEPPSSGSVMIDGMNPYTLGERDQAAFRGRTMGFVFQDHLLLPQLSAIENVLVPTLVASPGRDAAEGRTPPAEFEGRARELLAAVGLADRLDHLPGELSGGERQRVAVARALIRQPALVLCDEPTGNLDRSSAETVADLIISLHRDRRTMLIVVTHSPALATRCERRYELTDRTLVQQ